MIVGFNPGITSARLGHYYAYAQNSFWKLLHDSGLLPVPLGYEEDDRLPSFGIGVTDIVKRPSAGSGDLTTGEMAAGAKELERKLAPIAPGVVAFLGKGIYRAWAGLRASDPVAYGFQTGPGRIGCREFVAPSPSGRSGLPYAEKLSWYRRLAAELEAMPEKGSPRA